MIFTSQHEIKFDQVICPKRKHIALLITEQCPLTKEVKNLRKLFIFKASEKPKYPIMLDKDSTTNYKMVFTKNMEGTKHDLLLVIRQN